MDNMEQLLWELVNNPSVEPSVQEILDTGAVPRLKGYYIQSGKVSDSIYGGEGSTKSTGNRIRFNNRPLTTNKGVPLRIMIRSKRISTHDKNRGEIPFKDQILAMNHHFMRRLVMPYVGTSQFDVTGLSDTSVVIAAENLRSIPLENVIRAYMAKSTTETSLYQHYIRGERQFCGHILPEGLVANGPLPYVMDTPSTKSDEHDESIAPYELFKRGICTPTQYAQMRNSGLVAFGVVSQYLGAKGIILVDTKIEEGINSTGKIVSQDELYTLDSSRFWLVEDYCDQWKKFNTGFISELNPRSYSKEFARGFSEGDKGYNPEQRVKIALRYIDGIQQLTGKEFVPDTRSYEERVVTGLRKVVKELVA